MLWPYSLNAFAEQLNELKVENDGVTTMDMFSGKTTDINLKKSYMGLPSICLI